MWKVMIVDDEKLICKLVQALVEWARWSGFNLYNI